MEVQQSVAQYFGLPLGSCDVRLVPASVLLVIDLSATEAVPLSAIEAKIESPNSPFASIASLEAWLLQLYGLCCSMFNASNVSNVSSGFGFITVNGFNVVLNAGSSLNQGTSAADNGGGGAVPIIPIVATVVGALLLLGLFALFYLWRTRAVRKRQNSMLEQSLERRMEAALEMRTETSQPVRW